MAASQLTVTDDRLGLTAHPIVVLARGA